MLGQIVLFLLNTVVVLLVFLLLLRFHFQWLRVPFRNSVGEFLIVTTNWLVLPARRIVPSLAGLDIPTLLLAWLVQMFGLWAEAVIRGFDPSFLGLAAVATFDLARYSLYILVAAVIIQVVFSWLNPHTPVAPVLDAFTRPFLRPLRRFVPPIANFDLTPLVLVILAQIALIVLWNIRPALSSL